jgi:ABC-2 type transport system ATP-binding protein
MVAGRLLRTRARRWAALAVVVLIVAAVVVAAWPRSGPVPIRAQDEKITVPGGPGVGGTVTLDAGLYLPASTPAPAVIVAHGFGGSRASVDAQAQRLARDGFVVLTYSARGFGASTGRIGLDSLDYEVPDARALVDWRAKRPEERQDGPDDPRVGVTGGSYGGALALMLAGTDRRVDAVAAVATWNNLTQALFPNNGTVHPAGAPTPAAIPAGADGVFKRSWAAALMSSVISGVALPEATSTTSDDSSSVGDAGSATGSSNGDAGSATQPSGGGTGSGARGPGAGSTGGAGTGTGTGSTPPGTGPLAGAGCGRMMLDLCAAYAQVAQTGRLTPAMAGLLANSSPAKVAGNITAPTLLVQGENDTLFGLDQADANARAIAANGTTVAVSWYPGGHNGGGLDTRTQDRVTDWLQHYLAGTGPTPTEAFQYSVAGAISDSGRVRTRTVQVAGYPGLAGRPATAERTVSLAGPAQSILNPPGGLPAAISSLPGVGTSAAGALGSLTAIPGQTAVFTSAPVAATTVVTGSATVTLSVSRMALPAAESTGGDDSAVLYLSLAAVDGDAASGRAGNPVAALLSGGPAGGAVSPVRIAGLSAGSGPVTLTVHLPAVALQVNAGQALQVRVATTDQGYAGPTAPAVYRVSLAGGADLHVPTAGGTRVSASEEPVGLAIGLGVLVLVAVVAMVLAGRVRDRRPQRAAGAPPADTVTTADDGETPAGRAPLSITGLRKEYPGGVVAVDDVSFRLEHGQVLGLLGPNGAGKTTTLRMVMGLINPSAGEISVFGEPVRPGAEILSRVGSFVEGSGFLPHLSGRVNLRLYWRATGRPADDAHLDEALEIADLGTAINRKVKTYSQGMRQRLAIAQAMLGLPDLLLLDEPTNGLDPPQIHAMREVLRRYAATGRTVLVSSHLLSEVEQTCSHVVIIDRGRTIATGTVAEMVSASGEILISTPDPAGARTALNALDGIGDTEVTTGGLQVDLGDVPLDRALRAVLDAGVPVTGAAPRNRLEDVFLDLIGAGGPGAGATPIPGARPSVSTGGRPR